MIHRLNDGYINQTDYKQRIKLVGKALLFLRKEAGLYQRQISEYLGISKQAYSGYETGKSEPNIETLVRLAFLYNVDMDYLTCKWENVNAMSVPQKQAENDEFDNMRQLRLEIDLLKSEIKKIKEHYAYRNLKNKRKTKRRNWA